MTGAGITSVTTGGGGATITGGASSSLYRGTGKSVAKTGEAVNTAAAMPKKAVRMLQAPLVELSMPITLSLPAWVHFAPWRLGGSGGLTNPKTVRRRAARRLGSLKNEKIWHSGPAGLLALNVVANRPSSSAMPRSYLTLAERRPTWFGSPARSAIAAGSIVATTMSGQPEVGRRMDVANRCFSPFSCPGSACGGD
jgi:hypothetical protein